MIAGDVGGEGAEKVRNGGAPVVLLSTLSIRPGIVFDCWLSSSLHCSMWEPVGACGGDSDPGRQGKPSYPMVLLKILGVKADLSTPPPLRAQYSAACDRISTPPMGHSQSDSSPTPPPRGTQGTCDTKQDAQTPGHMIHKMTGKA